MKQSLLFLLLFVLTPALYAQRFHVEDFREDPSDLAAIRFPATDVNDHACAIIKVRSNIGGILFDSNLGITKIDERPDGIWLYVSPGERALRFMRQGIITKDFNIPAGIRIESSQVYILELLATTGEIDDPEIETQWLIITSEPDGAELLINDEPAGRTPYQNELAVGTYRWRLESNLYSPDQGYITLEPGDGRREYLHVILEPDYGTLIVQSEPEQGASIVLNGLNTNEITPATLQRIPSGEHIITLSMEDYATANHRVELNAGEQKELMISLRPSFAVVSINTEPSANIYINDQWHGNDSWQGRLSTGVYTFEARLDNHRSHRERQHVSTGEDISLSLRPDPITGNLRIISIPIGANIQVNGEGHGTTPVTIRNILIGEYEVGLSLTGFGTVSKHVTIEEGETAEVHAELPSGAEVVISSEPLGADVFIEGRHIGTTPNVSLLTPGSYMIRLTKDNLVHEELIQINRESQQSFHFDLNHSTSDKAALITNDVIKDDERFVRFRIVAGLNHATQTVETPSTHDLKWRRGFVMGGVWELDFTNVFSLEAGLLFASKGYSTYWFHTQNTDDYRFFYLEIPVAARFSRSTAKTARLYGQLGPYLGYEVIPHLFVDKGWSGLFFGGRERIDYGLMVGGGMQINSFLIGLSYSRGLADISPQNLGVKNKVVSYTVGYRF